MVNKHVGIWKVTSISFPSNTYICATDNSGGCFIVDPGLDADVVDKELVMRALRPTHIFCTHGHFDHVGSAAFLQKKYDAKVFLHANDMKTLNTSNFLLMAFKIPHRIELPEIETITGEECSIFIGNRSLRYHITPGHTPGSCVMQYGSAVFTGDTLYSRGVGLSRLPKENPAQLRTSLLALWNQLSDEHMIYPGHGEPASFSGIRQHNKALLEFMGISTLAKDKV